MNRMTYIRGAFLLTGCLLLAGCGKVNKLPDINAVTPTTGIEPTMEESAPTSLAVSGSASEGAALRPDSGVTQSPDSSSGGDADDEPLPVNPTPEILPDTQEPSAAAPEPSGSADTDTPDHTDEGSGDTLTVTSVPDTDPSANNAEIIKDYWNNSFLVWLPLFEKGTYKDNAYDESHDYIMLGDVSQSDIESYIAGLAPAGFDIDAGYLDASAFRFDGDLEYSAANSEGWEAFIDFDRDTSTAIIGSGYHTAATDGYRELMDTTLLGSIPEFTFGTFDSGMNDGSTWYAVFYDVDTDCAAYIDALKASGYTLDEDEGNESGIIWYNAESKDGLVCEFIYTDGMARIGCRKD